MRNITLTIIMLLYIVFPYSVPISEPDTTCKVLDNNCIQYIRDELGIAVPIIVKQDNEINAYTNGINIFITTGMLEVPKMTTDGIKVILLHEEGHIVNRSHSVRELYWRALQVELQQCDIDLNCRDAAILRYLKETKEDEYRCDAYAIRRAYDMKLNPEKACYTFKIFAQLNNYSLDDSGSTHPSSVDRYKKCVVGVSTGIIP